MRIPLSKKGIISYENFSRKVHFRNFPWKKNGVHV